MISLEEDYPPENEDVLVYYGEFDIGYWTYDKCYAAYSYLPEDTRFWEVMNPNGPLDVTVTHYMPLPDRPTNTNKYKVD
jgi:hypothetical protein